MKEPIRVLLASLVDYAGLFPPAGLAMARAVKNYSLHRSGDYRWALGRFIVPVSRLGELVEHASPLMATAGEPWHLSALASLPADLAVIDDFNSSHRGRAVIDAVETKADDEESVRRAAEAAPPGMSVYVEIASGDRMERMLDAIARAGVRAKIRTGGVTPDAFPSATAVARFMSLCAARRVAFKATAGLHHPLRCERPLTYEPESVRGTMHGFVNLFTAASLAREGADEAALAALLLEEQPSAFGISDRFIRWRTFAVSRELLAATRRELAIAFGSCSFEEPIADLADLGWL